MASLRILPQGFSLLKGVRWFEETDNAKREKEERETPPSLKIHTDKEIYRPGELITCTIEISSPYFSNVSENGEEREEQENVYSLLLENLSFEVKGIEKVDSQWFVTQKPAGGSKQKRGENVFMDCVAPSIVSKVIISSGNTKTYIVRVELPKILPPSYRGISIRYIYYVRSTLFARWIALNNQLHTKEHVNNLIQLEARAPLQIWVSQKNNNLLNDEGNLPVLADQMDIYWKEKDENSEWTRANDNTDRLEEGYDSSRDEVSSISSYNPGNIRNSLSMQSLSSRLSAGPTLPSYKLIPQLSVSEIMDETSADLISPERNSLDSHHSEDELAPPFTPRYIDTAASEGFMRGRLYNIKIDDQVLLRFSPKNSDSIYYFGDMIGGTLTFFHGEGTRRCLEVSITLETSETINQQFIHPSRRGSPTITKVHSEHHEVVSDLRQTSFLFSIGMEGPLTFSTCKVSLNCTLKFEFFTTPGGLDLTRYEHPLLIDKREKGEWVLPITVYAPPLRRQQVALSSKNDKPLSFGNLFIS